MMFGAQVRRAFAVLLLLLVGGGGRRIRPNLSISDLEVAAHEDSLKTKGMPETGDNKLPEVQGEKEGKSGTKVKSATGDTDEVDDDDEGKSGTKASSSTGGTDEVHDEGKSGTKVKPATGDTDEVPDEDEGKSGTKVKPATGDTDEVPDEDEAAEADGEGAETSTTASTGKTMTIALVDIGDKLADLVVTDRQVAIKEAEEVLRDMRIIGPTTRCPVCEGTEMDFCCFDWMHGKSHIAEEALESMALSSEMKLRIRLKWDEDLESDLVHWICTMRGLSAKQRKQYAEALADKGISALRDAQEQDTVNDLPKGASKVAKEFIITSRETAKAQMVAVQQKSTTLKDQLNIDLAKTKFTDKSTLEALHAESLETLKAYERDLGAMEGHKLTYAQLIDRFGLFRGLLISPNFNGDSLEAAVSFDKAYSDEVLESKVALQPPDSTLDIIKEASSQEEASIQEHVMSNFGISSANAESSSTSASMSARGSTGLLSGAMSMSLSSSFSSSNAASAAGATDTEGKKVTKSRFYRKSRYIMEPRELIVVPTDALVATRALADEFEKLRVQETTTEPPAAEETTTAPPAAEETTTAPPAAEETTTAPPAAEDEGESLADLSHDQGGGELLNESRYYGSRGGGGFGSGTSKFASKVVTSSSDDLVWGRRRRSRRRRSRRRGQKEATVSTTEQAVMEASTSTSEQAVEEIIPSINNQAAAEFLHRFGSHICPRVLLGGWWRITSTVSSTEEQDMQASSQVATSAISETVDKAFSLEASASGSYGIGLSSFKASVKASHESSSSQQQEQQQSKGETKEMQAVKARSTIDVTQEWQGGVSGMGPATWRSSLVADKNSNWKLIDRYLDHCIGLWEFAAPDYSTEAAGLCEYWVKNELKLDVKEVDRLCDIAIWGIVSKTVDVEVAKMGCPRPPRWCSAAGDKFSTVDCDGDGGPLDLVCTSSGKGIIGVMRRNNGCRDSGIYSRCQAIGLKNRCQRPKDFCLSKQETYRDDLDCDGDLVPDPFCYDQLGKVSSMSSQKDCLKYDYLCKGFAKTTDVIFVYLFKGKWLNLEGKSVEGKDALDGNKNSCFEAFTLVFSVGRWRLDLGDKYYITMVSLIEHTTGMRVSLDGQVCTHSHSVGAVTSYECKALGRHLEILQPEVGKQLKLCEVYVATAEDPKPQVHVFPDRNTADAFMNSYSEKYPMMMATFDGGQKEIKTVNVNDGYRNDGYASGFDPAWSNRWNHIIKKRDEMAGLR